MERNSSDELKIPGNCGHVPIVASAHLVFGDFRVQRSMIERTKYLRNFWSQILIALSTVPLTIPRLTDIG
uniref:Uncharacterized protein n=1 Tax=Trichuris muris TaxID=70415 RepID=A0A5S6Q6F1_TRIMR